MTQGPVIAALSDGPATVRANCHLCRFADRRGLVYHFVRCTRRPAAFIQPEEGGPARPVYDPKLWSDHCRHFELPPGADGDPLGGAALKAWWKGLEAERDDQDRVAAVLRRLPHHERYQYRRDLAAAAAVEMEAARRAASARVVEI